MPYPSAHRLVTFFGDAWSQSEIWQFGLRLQTGTPNVAPDVTQLDALIAAAHGWIGGPQFSNQIRFLGVKVAPQTTLGRYPDGLDAVERLRATPSVPQGTDSRGVPQICCVVSLNTSRSRGRGSRGRFYPPASNISVGPDGRIGLTAAQTYLTGATTFLNGVNDVGIGEVSVMSALDGGSSLPANGVRIGQVLDTQRRRRNQISEEYIQAPLDPP